MNSGSRCKMGRSEKVGTLALHDAGDEDRPNKKAGGVPIDDAWVVLGRRPAESMRGLRAGFPVTLEGQEHFPGLIAWSTQHVRRVRSAVIRRGCSVDGPPRITKEHG